MAHKLQEFLHLQQGSGSVYKYSKRFNHLSQYSSYHSDIDEKKMTLFRQGLNPVLHEHLMLFRGCTLNKLVSTSIKQEDTCHARMEEERKKRPLSGPTRGAPPKYGLVYSPPSGQPDTPRMHLTRGSSVQIPLTSGPRGWPVGQTPWPTGPTLKPLADWLHGHTLQEPVIRNPKLEVGGS
jgi:hypothetical protein